MSDIILLNKPAKSLLSTTQKTFNRLKKKIEALQRALVTQHKELDACLEFYQNQVQPAKQSLTKEQAECVKIMYEHYKDTKFLSNKERKLLKELLLGKINQIFSATTFKNADPQICAIFENLEGVNYADTVASEFKNMKAEMQEMFKESGIDVDLSTLDLADDEHDTMQKMFEAMQAAKLKMEQNEPLQKPKSKKQLQKELKVQEFEALQKKGISGLYKQLAKVFHPDLEQDPEQKIGKELLMKKLTSAYEKNDLHTLLLLEMEWLSHSNNQATTQSSDQLKIYNSLLKDQAEALQQEIDMVVLNPKYLPIQPYVEETFYSPLLTLQIVLNELKSELHYLQDLLKTLQTRDAKKTIRDILSDCCD